MGNPGNVEIGECRKFEINGHLGQMGTGAYGHRINDNKTLGANGHRSKWGLGANWLLEKKNVWGR